MTNTFLKNTINYLKLSIEKYSYILSGHRSSAVAVIRIASSVYFTRFDFFTFSIDFYFSFLIISILQPNFNFRLARILRKKNKAQPNLELKLKFNLSVFAFPDSPFAHAIKAAQTIFYLWQYVHWLPNDISWKRECI